MTLRNDLHLLRRALLPPRGGTTPAPWRLTYVATERCNLRCTICRVWEHPRPGPSTEEAEAFFSRSNGFSWVDVTGGEIFLRDDILSIFGSILRHCRRLAVLHFPTNGWLADRVEEGCRELVRMGAPRLSVTVSLDGPPAVHDALRGAAGSFDRAMDCFGRLLANRRVHAVLGLTLSEGNLGRVEETVAEARRRVPAVTARLLHVNLPNRSPHYYRNDHLPLPSPERLLAEVAALRKGRGVPAGVAELVERRLLSLAERFLRTGRTPVPCRALRAGCFVGADGTVNPCVTWERPVGELAAAGFDLGRIWNGEEAEAARAAVAAGDCPHCWTACEAVPSLAASWGGLRRP